MRKNFINQIRVFFDKKQSEFSKIMGASGCREGWLQAELYKYFNRNSKSNLFSCTVNKYPINDNAREKADFHLFYKEGLKCESDSQESIVCEIKVYGDNGFYNKNLSGFTAIINELAELYCGNKRIPIIISKDGRSFNHNKAKIPIKDTEGSLLKDVLRLHSINDKSVIKYMILVVGLTENQDTFGRVISQVKCSDRECSIRSADLLVRIWEINY